MSPSVRYPVYVPWTLFRTFQLNFAALGFPKQSDYPRGTSTVPRVWAEFFGFQSVNTYSQFHWMSNVGPLMQNYSKFFHGSVTLGNINATGLGAVLATAKYLSGDVLPMDYIFTAAVPNTAAQGQPSNAVPAYYTFFNIKSLPFDITHGTPDLPELAEQYSTVSQIHALYPDAPAGGVITAPADNIVDRGTVWDLPDIRASRTLDIVLGYGMSVRTHYHQATPLHNDKIFI